MAQTASWLTLAEASARIGVPEFEVLDLVVSNCLRSRLSHDHREVWAADADEFAGFLAEHATTDTPNDEGEQQ